MQQAAYYLAFAAAIAPLVSTAAANILLAAAFVAVLIAHRRLSFPPIMLPLGIFAGLTVISVLLSPDPVFGLPQIKKFYVFLILPIVFTALRRIEDVHRLIACWSVAAAASTLWSFVEFWRKREAALQAGHNFYIAYVADRVTGFMSHWMAFSGQLMVVLALLIAVLLWYRRDKALTICGVLISAGIVIALTRSVWLASTVSAAYLIAAWKPKWLLAAPLIFGVGFVIAPRSIQERVTSIYKPHGRVDSNEHRQITRMVGVEMIQAHPWFGIGPQMVIRDFYRYLPSSIRAPLPEGFYGHLHNVYLQYAAERGIPALLALLWAVAKATRDYATGLRNANPAARAVLHGALAVIIAILIEGFFEVNLGDSEVLSLFLSTLACGYIAKENA